MSKCSPWCLMGPICSSCVHSKIHLHYACGQNLFPIVPAVWHFPVFWIVDPLTPPPQCCHIVGRIVFSLCPFPDESADVYQIWCQSVQQFDSFPRHLNLWPPKTPRNAPWDIQGRLLISVCPFPDESADVNQSWCQSLQPIADVYQIWCQSVQQFDSFPRHLNLWPPKTPRNAPWDIQGRLLISVCPFPDESADVNQSWCQSLQPAMTASQNFWIFYTL